MKHLMTLWDDPFKMISCGQKDIEMRLYDEKRRKITVGDTIEFTNKKTNQKMEVIVINLHIYDSFEMLYSKFEKTRLGYKKDEIANPKDMETYYNKQAILDNKVVGIEIKVI